MKKFLIGLSLIVGASSAMADHGQITAGVLGGLILGGALAQPRQVYVQPQPVYVQPQPVYVSPPVYYQPAPRPPVVYRYDGRYQLPPAQPPGYYSQEDYFDPACGCNVRIYR